MDRNPIKSLSPKLIKNSPSLFYINFNTHDIDDRVIEEMLVRHKGPQYAHKSGYFFLPDWHDKRQHQTSSHLSETIASLESPSIPSLTVSRQTERPMVDVIHSNQLANERFRG